MAYPLDAECTAPEELSDRPAAAAVTLPEPAAAPERAPETSDGDSRWRSW